MHLLCRNIYVQKNSIKLVPIRSLVWISEENTDFEFGFVCHLWVLHKIHSQRECLTTTQSVQENITTFHSMTVLVLMDCIKPRPGVKCHGQKRVMWCGEPGDSHLGVFSYKSSSAAAVKRSAFALSGLVTCSAQSSQGSHWCW